MNELATFYEVDVDSLHVENAILKITGDDFLTRDLPKGYLKGVNDAQEGEFWKKAWDEE